ncbi:Rv0361 family membrane protein [Tomitella biformata]|uniref:Rv0361 family membrane protein n=1 Tax=Tomitella biformata TaxID=630403 RepID=UPI000465F01C|nr:hypothetical protein [Tomitella biformata]
MNVPQDFGPEPDLDDFLAPDEPRKSRRLMISVVAALTVLAMVAVAVTSVLVWAGDDAPAAGAQEPAAQASNPQITDAANQYVAAVNEGIAADYLGSICSPLRTQLGDITDTTPADPKMAVLEVTDVTIRGEIATANVAIAPADVPDATPRTDKLRFLNEDGWKFCGQAQ